jgi:hypothetical protein
MSKFIKSPDEKSDMHEKLLLEAFKEVRESGNAFILIYRNKVTEENFIDSYGYTVAEGIYAAEMLRDLAMYGDGGDGDERKVKFQ